MERAAAKGTEVLRLPLGATNVPKPAVKARVVSALAVAAAIAVALLPLATPIRACLAMGLLAAGMVLQLWGVDDHHVIVVGDLGYTLMQAT